MSKTVKLADVIPSRYAHLTPANEENIERIRADLVDGSKVMLNEPHVFREGDKYELLAGHDRVEAAERAGWTKIQVREFVTLNTEDAILAHFCRENLLRKEVSKAAIAGEWLRQHTDWVDTRIAAESGCSGEYVGQVRSKMVEAGELQVVEVRTTESGETRRYKARQVRGNVPSGKTIPHPTAKVPDGKEDAATMGAALFAPKPAPQQEAPEPEGSTGTTDTPEVGVPTGAPLATPAVREESVLPAWVVAALPVARLPYLPLTNAQALALSEEDAAKLHVFGMACQNAGKRSKALRDEAKKSVAA